MKKYTTTLRAPSTFTLPKGTWTPVETGTEGCFPLRDDLPRGFTKFGVFTFDRDLTPDELVAFDIIEVPDTYPTERFCPYCFKPSPSGYVTCGRSSCQEAYYVTTVAARKPRRARKVVR